MKKLIILVICTIMAFGLGMAQNANRSGFFLEAGFGGLIGNTPRVKFLVNNDLVQYECLSGMAAEFGLGFRSIIGKHWAYELKAEAQIPAEETLDNLSARFLPIGFRYVSNELTKNISLYTHFNVGGALTRNKGVGGNHDSIIVGDNGYIVADSSSFGWGGSYSVGIGINITTHFYIEGCLNSQIIIDGYGKKKEGLLHYGVFAGILGYRF